MSAAQIGEGIVVRTVTGPLVAAAILAMAPAALAKQVVWRFDNLSRIGGVAPQVEGAPRLVDSPLGKAVRFNGKDTALFFSRRPLVGARTFTIEAIFRPAGGAFEQRWLHIAETDPVTGRDTGMPGHGDPNPRFMFEIRVVKDRWYLDAFVRSKAGSRTLAFPDKLHPVGPWYAVEQTYDGKTYRSYVDGVLQGAGDVAFTPHGPGHVMVGARMNGVNFFNGDIAELRFTDHALRPDRFLKVPAQ